MNLKRIREKLERPMPDSPPPTTDGPIAGDALHQELVDGAVPVAYQDESGDLYCPTHARDTSRPYTRAELATWTSDLSCDFCGKSLP